MRLWLVILGSVIGLSLVSAIYLGIRVGVFLRPKNASGRRWWLLGSATVLGVTGMIGLSLNWVNAVICLIHVALIWGICDGLCWGIKKISRHGWQHDWAGWMTIGCSLIVLGSGWYLDHHVWRTEYTLTTKKIASEMTIVMFADAHLGTTFDEEGFARHIAAMQAENPDLVVVVGDYVDDGTTKEEMVKASQALGRMQTKYGVYFVFGNHDRGYYGAARRGFSAQDLIDALTQSGVIVLRDETVMLENVRLIGRRDLSDGQRARRQPMAALIPNQDNYTIVLDHQPADYDNQQKAGADLVLSGHTHGGQLFPFNRVGKWLGVNNLVYGHERRGQTDFIVTSGLSNWALRFKTGTKSEYVVIQVRPARSES